MKSVDATDATDDVNGGEGDGEDIRNRQLLNFRRKILMLRF